MGGCWLGHESILGYREAVYAETKPISLGVRPINCHGERSEKIDPGNKESWMASSQERSSQ
jgi:hypothetical protein